MQDVVAEELAAAGVQGLRLADPVELLLSACRQRPDAHESRAGGERQEKGLGEMQVGIVRVSLCACVRVPVCLCACVYVCLSVCACLPACLPVCVGGEGGGGGPAGWHVSLCLFVFLCVFGMFWGGACVCACMHACMCMCVCVPVCVRARWVSGVLYVCDRLHVYCEGGGGMHRVFYSLLSGVYTVEKPDLQCTQHTRTYHALMSDDSSCPLPPVMP